MQDRYGSTRASVRTLGAVLNGTAAGAARGRREGGGGGVLLPKCASLHTPRPVRNPPRVHAPPRLAVHEYRPE